MELNRFKECAAAYGAERRRWPEREHALYDGLASSELGAAILAEANRSDRFLDALQTAAPDASLTRRIGALSKPASRPSPAWRRLGVPAAALAASALLGFALGFSQARSNESDADLAARLLLGPQSLQEIDL